MPVYFQGEVVFFMAKVEDISGDMEALQHLPSLQYCVPCTTVGHEFMGYLNGALKTHNSAKQGGMQAMTQYNIRGQRIMHNVGHVGLINLEGDPDHITLSIINTLLGFGNFEIVPVPGEPESVIALECTGVSAGSGEDESPKDEDGTAR